MLLLHMRVSFFPMEQPYEDENTRIRTLVEREYQIFNDADAVTTFKSPVST